MKPVKGEEETSNSFDHDSLISLSLIQLVTRTLQKVLDNQIKPPTKLN